MNMQKAIAVGASVERWFWVIPVGVYVTFIVVGFGSYFL